MNPPPSAHPINVTRDFNLGTIVTVCLFLIAQSVAALWWAATISGDVRAMRAWQSQQDDRLVRLENNTALLSEQAASLRAIMASLREDVQHNSKLVLELIREDNDKPPLIYRDGP